MRPSRELGVAVLLMLGASGCAGVPQRTGLAGAGSDGSAQASTSGWFGSRWWRPMPTETTRQGSEIAPEYESAKKTSPETNIWPENRPTSTTRLSRLFTRFGRRDNAGADPSSLTDSDSQARGLKTTARPGTGRGGDRQVQPVAAMRNEDDPTAGGTASRLAPGVASQDVPPLLASPIAVAVPEKPYDRPAFQGNVALSVARADLPTGDAQAGTNSLDDRLAASPGLVDQSPDSAASEFGQGRPKRESYLIPTAGGAADLQASETEEPAQAAPGQAPAASPTQSTLPPPPPIEPAQTAPRTRPAQPPAGSGRPGMTRPAAPAQQPAAPPARRTAPAPAPTPAQAPATRAPRPTTPAPAPAPPVAVPAPVTEPARAPVETAPTPTPPTAPAPAAPAQQPEPAVTAQQSLPGAVVTPTALNLSSPQAEGCGCETAAKPPRKPCWLKTWIHSLHHQPEPEVFASPQLPPPMFPTTYQMCQSAQKTSCPPAAVPVQPTLQQPAQPTPQARTKKCCLSWIGKGPVTCLVKKIKKLGSGCRCHCHCCPDQAARPACGGSCATGNCETGTIAPSPQAHAVSPQAQAQAGTSLLDPEPGDVAQGGEVLDRIAAQGLDKAPER